MYIAGVEKSKREDSSFKDATLQLYSTLESVLEGKFEYIQKVQCVSMRLLKETPSVQFSRRIRSGLTDSAGTSRFRRVYGIPRILAKILSTRTCPIRITRVSSRTLKTTDGTAYSLFQTRCRQCCSPSAIRRTADMKCRSLFPRPIRKDRLSVSWRCRRTTRFIGVR